VLDQEQADEEPGGRNRQQQDEPLADVDERGPHRDPDRYEREERGGNLKQASARLWLPVDLQGAADLIGVFLLLSSFATLGLGAMEARRYFGPALFFAFFAFGSADLSFLSGRLSPLLKEILSGGASHAPTQMNLQLAD
jgi:hypothetical protein